MFLYLIPLISENPCGKKNALWISGRSSYIDLLYGRWLKFSGSSVNYHFMDYNLTYSSALTEKDQLVVTGFYSRDGMRIEETEVFKVPVSWQNIVASAYWNHRLENGNWRTTAYYSSYDNSVEVNIDPSEATTGMFPVFPEDTVHTYQMKISRIDAESYRFWSEYASMISSQGVFFVPVFQNIHGNISDGIGNFTGMGSSSYELRMAVDTTYIF